MANLSAPCPVGPCKSFPSHLSVTSWALESPRYGQCLLPTRRTWLLCESLSSTATASSPSEVPKSPQFLHRVRSRQAQLQQSLGRALVEKVDTDPPRLLATHFRASPRLSMPLASDDSGSEPDLSLLGMARGGDDPEARFNAIAYGEAGGEDDDEILSQAHYGIEDTSIEEQVEEQDTAPLLDPATIGLKEISNLGKFTVSSHKPSCGVDELQKDDLKLCWQSDGPQPHKLTVYFAKRVGIRDIRFFVNYGEDESYTPSKIVFKSGTSENNLIEFATMILECPVGWQQVPIKGAGGEPDGNTLVSYVLQMQILENHQNGKDTHLRGFKIYAFDVEAAHGAGRESSVAGDDLGLAGQEGSGDRLGDIVRSLAAARLDSGGSGFTMPDFMREPEIR
ncbi:Anaphase-promoting complex, subunit 10/DOC domain protein [Ophiocordyceps sinensis CO18]|uniref:Anaphase-promoting complex, subunit 10/DOC domain protein n=1 Tax=Ophiocordyceps sinensis (strain Co18 / CGMCC 3.14243) TaxID=911162 RepID=T5AQ98_OPHSC|nr:Anaphase-promoting complex, subunit 10/DOC domain protein [Ophiocordyceps sinensis CO18]